MAGRRDYGQMMLSSLNDPRILDAAETLGMEVFAVAGAIAALGGTLARDTDDGIIRGRRQARVVSRAIGCDEAVAAAVLETLEGAGLIVKKDGGLYLRGWEECYRPMLNRRRGSANTSAKSRSKTARSASEVTRHVTEPSSHHVTEPSTLLSSSLDSSLEGVDVDSDTAFSNRGYLSATLRQALALDGVRSFRGRPGDWWKWEKEAEALFIAGVRPERIARWLLDDRNATSRSWEMTQELTGKTTAVQPKRDAPATPEHRARVIAEAKAREAHPDRRIA